MNVQYLNPFLDSASFVIEQLCNVTIKRGELEMTEWYYRDDHTWIRIGMTGQLEGDVFFGLQNDLALRLVSAMMGGFPVNELDEIGKSAISELGNMISGNASTMLYNQGVVIDITPPQFIQAQENRWGSRTAYTVPLDLSDMGRMEIQVLVGK
ncbi:MULTISPECIES: chemotaxis protein CheX [Brevibacillus]|uniref:CheY-P phosphatase n=2 Tax=Brevibacillus borstelensis TaxID=45462 RepID=M8E0S9_9BACL|nr:chemotaxis protein CheX [Brevibacillus borstelensis]EMT52901.1 CheY-P phosphatase [Brevibacillus borstelensis AK1]KKX55686.1 chemotaxis protein CheC [Brevibacillus borstelensis cifa_chp40]MBE5397125.1 chemotaxis protein CheX [Brevibacillus borstelensis]MCC0566416.1 chemotaxis protein CheX [Brevibacillus borstelensis]MCM3471586.1 chemotaxis protein CheX [Brevibacillus borstelensis]